MLRGLFFILFFFVFTQASTAQTKTWNGGAVDDYQDASKWLPAGVPTAGDVIIFNTPGNVIVTNVPNTSIAAININGTSLVTFITNSSTNVLTLTAATPLIYTTAGTILAGDLLTIALSSAASFTMSSGTFGIAPSSGGKILINGALTLAGGTLDFDVVGTGGSTIFGTGSITYFSGIFNSLNVTAITWNNGSNYNHAVDGTSASAIPVSNWAPGSNCNITGMNSGTVAPAGFTNVSFSNLTWNCPAQSGNVNLDFGGNPVNISGNFTLTSTGSATVKISGTGSSVINVSGNYTQGGGRIALQSSTGTTNLNIAGNFTHTGGTIDFVSAGSASGTATLNVQGGLKKAATWSSTSTNTSSKMTIQFSGNSTQVVDISGTWNLPAAGTCNILNSNNGGAGVSLNSGSLNVSNMGSASPATCINAGKFSGTGSLVYTGTTSLQYVGTVPQTASAVEFPATTGPTNLVINNLGGVSFPTSSYNRSISGTLSMLVGNLSLGASNTLSLTNTTLSSQISYTAGFITSGSLARVFPNTGLPTIATNNSLFPFGTGINNRAINVIFSASAITSGGIITISHAAIVGATDISTLSDNGVNIDRITNSNWAFNTGTLDLGTESISVTAQANNIGSVNDLSSLRFTDGTNTPGSIIPATGTEDAPLLGRSALSLTDINGKIFYIGSDKTLNPLQIVTYTWTGLNGTAWTDKLNWSPNTGYPASQTEIAIIASGSNMPVITSGIPINLYQLTVGASASLTMTGSGNISVFDNITFPGTALFSGTSTFTYANPDFAATQNIVDLPYVNLAVDGLAVKNLPSITTVTGNFIINGTSPNFGTGTFIYQAGSALQRVAAASYYKLTITGNRSGGTIKLGSGGTPNIIDVANVFTMTATNYNATCDAYNTFNFSAAGTQTIPGFTYGSITNNTSGGGIRIYDPLGSANPANVVLCKSFSSPSPYVRANNITTGSKVVLNRDLSIVPTGNTALSTFYFNDFEITGNMGGRNLSVTTNNIVGIAGKFVISATNFKQPATNHFFEFNGTGIQTIPGFKSSGSTPGWKYSTLTVTNDREIILDPVATDTINITGKLKVPASFTAGNGFTTAGSTINFITGSEDIPVLVPKAGTNNYNNITVTSGTRLLGGNITLGGDLNVIGSDAEYAQLNIGGASLLPQKMTILGNLNVKGTSASAQSTSLIDFNNKTFKDTIYLAGNLNISGVGQITTQEGSTNTSNGILMFNGTAQQYTNTSAKPNGYVNFTVGNGTSVTNLTLNSNLGLIRSNTIPYSSTLTVSDKATLNAGTRNVTITSDDNNASNNAKFNLNAGATLITANTGLNPHTAIEGNATDGTNGTVLSGTKITKNYNIAASYVLNGATVKPFPSTITTMANLTIGADVSLNRDIDVNSTLDLASFTLTQEKNDLEFSGLTSITGSIYADKFSTLSINGTIGTVGTLRFATGGTTTGQFTINRPVTVLLGGDLTIEKSPESGNFITGTVTSILDINGNTLTINGGVSGSGFLGGSGTSNLTLGGAAGTVNFVTGKQILKNLTLVNNATGTLGTVLDITGGTGPGTEGTVSVTSSATLTTGGNLTLKSNANGTARVAAGATLGGYISGDVTVERFLSSNRSWRFLAAPSYGQTIHQAWQENQPAGSNLLPGFGTNITSNRASWIADGFDFQTPGNSLLIYNPLTNVWEGALNTSSPISAAGGNKSYMLFLRGDRSVTPAVGAPSTTAVVRTRGTLFQGNLAPLAVTAGQYAAVGNNYASAIDFTMLSKLNVDQSFTLWDPYIPGAKSLGAWVTFSAATGWLPSIAGGSYLNVANTRIESGQAFMVHNSSVSAGSLTLTENSKLSGSKLVSRPSGINGNKQMLITNLYNTNGGVANITDGSFVVFSEDYSNVIDSWDAVKMNNFGDNFGLSRDGQILVVDARQPVAETDTIFFNMKKVKQQPYRLEFIAKDFDASLMGFLEDNYLHSTAIVNMAGTTSYDFSVTSDAAAAAANRFRIVFKNSAPLPVTFTNITATEKANGIAVEWKVENEINIASYDVERSVDGRNFTKMNSTVATGQSTSGAAAYNWLDTKTIAGDNFYRIRSISRDGKTEYSRIVKVTLEKGKAGFTVYPNPVADGMIGLQLKNIPTGVYNVRILNSNGQLISKEIIKHTGGNGTQTITSAKQLVSGTYQLEITGEDKNVNVLRLLVL